MGMEMEMEMEMEMTVEMAMDMAMDMTDMTDMGPQWRWHCLIYIMDADITVASVERLMTEHRTLKHNLV